MPVFHHKKVFDGLADLFDRGEHAIWENVFEDPRAAGGDRLVVPNSVKEKKPFLV